MAPKCIWTLETNFKMWD